MGKLILLHTKKDGESVLVNTDSISMVSNNSNPDGGSILILESQHRNCLYVREPLTQIYVMAKEE